MPRLCCNLRSSEAVKGIIAVGRLAFQAHNDVLPVLILKGDIAAHNLVDN